MPVKIREWAVNHRPDHPLVVELTLNDVVTLVVIHSIAPLELVLQASRLQKEYNKLGDVCPVLFLNFFKNLLA
jgi:hypothetical protein